MVELHRPPLRFYKCSQMVGQWLNYSQKMGLLANFIEFAEFLRTLLFAGHGGGGGHRCKRNKEKLRFEQECSLDTPFGV